jgi:hypothetical protein
MPETKKYRNGTPVKVFLVLYTPYNITYVVTVPGELSEAERRRISKSVIDAANQYYKTPIAMRRKLNIDHLKWMNTFVELAKFKNVLIEEAG